MDYQPLRDALLDVHGEDLEVEVGGVRRDLRAAYLAPYVDAVGGFVQRPAPVIRAARTDADGTGWEDTEAGSGDFVIRGGSESDPGTRYRVVNIGLPDGADMIEVTLRHEP